MSTKDTATSLVAAGAKKRLDNARIPYTSCPLCKSAEFVAYGIANCSRHLLYRPELPETISWCRCETCHHVFTDGYFSDEALKLLFSATQDDQIVGFDLESQRHVSARMIDRVLSYATGGNWLDVGFGNGSLLLTVEEYGFKPVGIDLREASVAALTAVGVEAYCQDINQFSYASAFDVISMADVLEHMPFPIDALKAAHSMQRKGGVLFVSMPNMDSYVWKALNHQKANPYWSELEHYHNFGRGRLYQLLREVGYEPVRYGVSERYRACMEVIARKT